MKRQLIAAAALAAVAATGPALAQQGNNYVDGYFTLSEIDAGAYDDDDTGLGLKGSFQVANRVFLDGEFQSVDFSAGDLDQIRLGASFGPGAGSRAEGLYGRAQYVNLDFGSGGDSDQDGVGGHVGYGLPLNSQFRLHGELGYLLLDDLDGPELLVGGTYQLAPNFAVFADYRTAFLDADGGGDVDLSDLRVGARFLF